jgi:hypothetical protein
MGMSFTGINTLLKLVCRERGGHICRVQKAVLDSTCKKYIHVNRSFYSIKIVVTSSAYFHSIYIGTPLLGYHLTVGEGSRALIT